MNLRNFAILAHVDAGKTTLSERILFNAGEISSPGDVDDGLATMDYLPDEKERGITIEAGLASFQWKGCHCNFLDTPGHVDFGVEVDMSLVAVEGAVLVIDATAGVETQTVAAWRRAKQRNLQTLVFLNKLDRPESRANEALLDIEDRLCVRPILMDFPWEEEGNTYMCDILSRGALAVGSDGREAPVAMPVQAEARWKELRQEAIDAAATVNDQILAMALDGVEPDARLLARALAECFSAGDYIPVYQGSALANQGVRQLMTGISLFLPSPEVNNSEFMGSVVRIRHHRGIGELVLLKLTADFVQSDLPSHIKILRIEAEQTKELTEACSGDIVGMLDKLGTAWCLGDTLSQKGTRIPATEDYRKRYTPLLMTRLEPTETDGWRELSVALECLQRSDPSIFIETKADSGAFLLHSVGEVQLEVAVSRLKREFGCHFAQGKPEVEYRERLKHGFVGLKNSFSLSIGSVHVNVDLEPNETDEVKLEWFASQEETAAEIATMSSALHEWAHAGILAKGPLVGVTATLGVVVEGGCPHGMLKKTFTDALRLGVPRDTVELWEPWVQLEVECPPEYAGILLGDLESRHAKILGWEGDGRLSKILCEGALQDFFGYSIIGRSISKGTASYALRYLRHRAARSRA